MQQTSSRWVIDIETDGLTPTVVWCIVAQDVDTGVCKRFVTHQSAKPFLYFMKQVDVAIFHNGLGYDVPVLERLLGVDFSGIEVVDTLILSHLFGKTVKHSLDAWGEELGYAKGDYSDWSKFTWEMMDYCQRDVEVTTKLYKHLMQGLTYLDPDVIDLEYETKKQCMKQEEGGWHFDIEGAHKLLATISSDISTLEFEVRDTFTPLPMFKERADMEASGSYKNKDGSYHSLYLKQLEEGCHKTPEGWGFYEYPEFNLGSRLQIGEQLVHRGWKPSVLTPTGKPTINEDVLENVPIPEAKLIAKYLSYDKIRSFLKGWIDVYNEDTQALHGRVRTLGTVTHRMSSNSPNMQQVPSSRKPFGTEIRALFKARDGKVIVGADLSGLELRCLAHYMGDKDYTNELLNGDIHVKNQMAAGLPDRDAAKTFIYAFLYGCGPELTGAQLGKGVEEGRRVQESFLKNIPALGALKSRAYKAATRGYVKSIDGRKIYTRKPMSALNFLLQSAGSIIAKRSWYIFHNKAKHLNYKQLGVIHDEIQIECSPEDSEAIGKLLVQSMEETTSYYNLSCPITGEYQTAGDWSGTH